MSRNSVQLQSLKMSLWISFLLVCTPLLLNHFTPLKPLNSGLTLKQLLLAYHLLQFSTVGIQTALNSLSAVRKYHPILAHFGLFSCNSDLASANVFPLVCCLSICRLWPIATSIHLLAISLLSCHLQLTISIYLGTFSPKKKKVWTFTLLVWTNDNDNAQNQKRYHYFFVWVYWGITIFSNFDVRVGEKRQFLSDSKKHEFWSKMGWKCLVLYRAFISSGY